MVKEAHEDAAVARLNEALDELHASKAELARAASRSDVAVNGWFKPKRKLPSTWPVIAAALNTIAEQRGMARRWTVAELLGEEPAPTEPPRPNVDAVIDELRARGLHIGHVGETPPDLVPVGPAVTKAVRCYGAVPCGTPLRLGDGYSMVDVLADQLPASWHDDCYTLRAVGDSMEDWGIYAGELLVIDPTRTPEDMDVVIATVDGATTCKLLRRGAAGVVILEATSGDYPPIVVTHTSEYHCNGVVTHVLPRPFRPGPKGRR